MKKRIIYLIGFTLLIGISLYTYKKNNELLDQSVINAFSTQTGDEDILRSIAVPFSETAHFTYMGGRPREIYRGEVSFSYHGMNFVMPYEHYGQTLMINCCEAPFTDPTHTDGCAVWITADKGACVHLGLGYQWWD